MCLPAAHRDVLEPDKLKVLDPDASPTDFPLWVSTYFHGPGPHILGVAVL